ncbi:hypothetical protein [Vibrio sp. WXL210]|uniref:hypothetical protein n=1 Tax=Vibrio sp. WXL210 TaxID=3450709 RepID=UPI003EC86D68
MDKLISKSLMSSFAMLLIAAPVAQAEGIRFEQHARQGSLLEQGCAWGRGAQAIEDAKADAINSLKHFLRSPSAKQLTAGDFDQFIRVFDDNTRQRITSAFDQGHITPEYSDPFLRGSDTCIDATVTNDAISQIDSGSIVWGESSSQSTLVMGNSANASHISGGAERQALFDAIAKGIASTFNWAVSAEQLELMGTNDNRMVVAVRQTGQATRIVLLEQWQQLDSNPQADGNVNATFNLAFSQPSTEKKTQIVRTHLAQPAVFIETDDKRLSDKMHHLLSQRGERVVMDVNQAAIIVKIDSNYPESITGQQLSFTVDTQDLSGQRFSHWQNDASLIALGASSASKQQLANTHFAHSQAQKEIEALLDDTMLKLFDLGGPQIKVYFQPSKVGNEAQLTSLMSVIDNVRNVSVKQVDNFVVVTLRYPQSATQLARYLTPTLEMHQPDHAARVEIVHDYHIVVE